MKIPFALLIILNLIVTDAIAQITYNDSCLSLELYYSNATGKLSNAKTIHIKEPNTKSFFQSDDTTLNLFVCFRNKCNKIIEIPGFIYLDMPGDDDFMIEGIHIATKDTTTLLFNNEYDYHERSNPYSIYLPPNKMKLLSFKFPLGFDESRKGFFQFRLRFYNQHNYIPIAEFKYYYTNWVTLNIK